MPKNKYSIVTSGDAELVANAQLQLYGSIIRQGRRRMCSKRFQRYHLQRIQRKHNNA